MPSNRVRALARILNGLPLALISPVLVDRRSASRWPVATSSARLRRRKPLPADTQPDTHAASIVIPNWNGRDLLEKYLPSVIAAVGAASRVSEVDRGR